MPLLIPKMVKLRQDFVSEVPKCVGWVSIRTREGKDSGEVIILEGSFPASTEDLWKSSRVC